MARLVAEISLAKPYHSALLYATGEDLKLAQRFRRAAPDPAPPTVLAVPRDADVRALRGAVLGLRRGARAAVRQAAAVQRAALGRGGRRGARRRGAAAGLRAPRRARRASCASWSPTTIPTNREVIGKILERGGHARHAGERRRAGARRASSATRRDLVILDRNMPGMGGMEALQALRLMTRGRERLPVIMLSADVTPEAKREALEAGADAFLRQADRGAAPARRNPARLPAPKAAPRAQRRAAAACRRGRGAAAPAVVNAETLAHLEELGSSLAFVEKLVGVFLADSAALLARIEKVLAARNYHEFRSLLHAMKGSSASMGTDRLTRLCDRPRTACPTPSCGCRRRRCSASSARRARRGARAARALPAANGASRSASLCSAGGEPRCIRMQAKRCRCGCARTTATSSAAAFCIDARRDDRRASRCCIAAQASRRCATGASRDFLARVRHSDADLRLSRHRAVAAARAARLPRDDRGLGASTTARRAIAWLRERYPRARDRRHRAFDRRAAGGRRAQRRRAGAARA